MKINLGKYFDLGNLLSEKYNFLFHHTLEGGEHEHPKGINDFLNHYFTSNLSCPLNPNSAWCFGGKE